MQNNVPALVVAFLYGNIVSCQSCWYSTRIVWHLGGDDYNTTSWGHEGTGNFGLGLILMAYCAPSTVRAVGMVLVFVVLGLRRYVTSSRRTGID